MTRATTPNPHADARHDPIAALTAELAQAEQEHASQERIEVLRAALHAEQQSFIEAQLAEHRRQVNAYADSVLADTRLTEALADIADAAQRIRALAAEHNAAVDSLRARALELGAGTPGITGVRVGPAWISGQHIVRKLYAATAMHAALEGNAAVARNAARLVTNAWGRPVQ